MATMAPTLQCIHHMAFRCKDAEETKNFYVDVMGLKMKAALAIAESPGSGEPRKFMHLFFEMDDGNFIAFFDDPAGVEKFDFKPMDGFDCHLAFGAASKEELGDWQKRFDEHGVANFGPVDHGFVHSIYFWDPNGVALEITYKDEKYDAILAAEEAHSDQQIRDWTAAKAAGAQAAE